jgi:hypothetical protein
MSVQMKFNSNQLCSSSGDTATTTAIDTSIVTSIQEAIQLRFLKVMWPIDDSLKHEVLYGKISPQKRGKYISQKGRVHNDLESGVSSTQASSALLDIPEDNFA